MRHAPLRLFFPSGTPPGGGGDPDPPTPLFLESFGTSVCSFSCSRILRPGVTNIMQVRRDDGDTLDIGAVNNLLDVDTLMSFVGAGGNGWITRLYQQAITSAPDATQDTASRQPNIVMNGVLQTINGVPAMRVTQESQMRVTHDDALNLVNNYALIGVAKHQSRLSIANNTLLAKSTGTSGGASSYMLDRNNSGTHGYRFVFWSAAGTPRIVLYAQTETNDAFIHAGYVQTGQVARARWNTAEVVSSVNSFDTFTNNVGLFIGGRGADSARAMDGYIGEIHLLQNQFWADRDALFNSLNSTYNGVFA